jgi:hypothetical protein
MVNVRRSPVSPITLCKSHADYNRGRAIRTAEMQEAFGMDNRAKRRLSSSDFAFIVGATMVAIAMTVASVALGLVSDVDPEQVFSIFLAP